MTDLPAQLRLALALAHTLPGGVIELGVVVVVLAASSDAEDPRENELDDAARLASSACFVQELLHATRTPSSAS